MKKPKRIKAPVLLTRDEFEIIIDRIATCTTALRKQEADRDDDIQRVQAAYAREIGRLTDYIAADAALCEKYAEAHRDELLPGKAKSAETPLARYGFRTGMPQLKLKSKVTWEKVVEVLQDEKRILWLRTKVEAAKDAILAACQARPETAEIADRIGIRVVQDETFYIEPKVDGADQVKAGGAS